jgi:hypothetical protein
MWLNFCPAIVANNFLWINILQKSTSEISYMRAVLLVITMTTFIIESFSYSTRLKMSDEMISWFLQIFINTENNQNIL